MVMSRSEGPRSGVRLQRSTVLLVSGIVAGVGIGFTYGLIKPRPKA